MAASRVLPTLTWIVATSPSTELGGREKETLGVSAAGLAAAIDHPDVRHVSGLENAARQIVERAEPDAVVITLSAGDGNQVGVQILEQGV